MTPEDLSFIRETAFNTENPVNPNRPYWYNGTMQGVLRSMMPILRPDEPHEHWFACIRCGADHPKEKTRKKRAQPVQDAPRSTKAKRAEPCAAEVDR